MHNDTPYYSLSTVIYYSGVHPYTLNPVYVPRSKSEKENQHKFFFWYKRENRNWVINKLSNLGQMDLLRRLTAIDKSKVKDTSEHDKETRFDSLKKNRNSKSKKPSFKSKNPNSKTENSKTKKTGSKPKKRKYL